MPSSGFNDSDGTEMLTARIEPHESRVVKAIEALSTTTLADMHGIMNRYCLSSLPGLLGAISEAQQVLAELEERVTLEIVWPD
jgi:hypothetical protein